ncbi:class II aldolase/adducin family protein [Streptomyces sp. NPDC052236]|uniref:class II aldolase/adducin family protein n=1 Tax=Streptomyces sp. NPDC052236 TaxID=3365686 RepID=UPI0037CF22B6
MDRHTMDELMGAPAETPDTLIRHMIHAARFIAEAGLLTPSGHANMTARLPGDPETLYLIGKRFDDSLREDDVAVINLRGGVRQGAVEANVAEVLGMHTAVYQRLTDVNEVNVVLHTHSPHTTAFAVAGRPMEVAIEALALLGVTRPVPVTRAYAPRGGEDAVGQILEAIGEDSPDTPDTPGTPAVLLANHGLLLWGRHVAHAVYTLLCLEENAQMVLASQALGGPRVIDPEQTRRALARAEAFRRAGDLTGSPSASASRP